MKVQALFGIVLGCLLHTFTVSGQGTINFSNLGANDNQKVYLDSVGGPLAPAGTTYSLGLYWAPDGTTDESAFAMIGAPTGIIGAAGTPSGLFSGGTRNVPVAPAGGPVMLQVRAWTSAFGSSYEQAMATGLSSSGKSSIFRVSDTSTAANILNHGFSAFAIVVPEPSTYAMGAMAIGLLALLRKGR